MIFFWSAWLAVGIALIILFLCKIPALFFKYVIPSACGSGDYGILTANLQDGSSILCEPSAASSRFMARYQIYQRNSNRKFFIGEWKFPVDSARYSLFCYDSGGALIDVIRVRERIDRKRYTAVSELPQSTDYIVLRLTEVNGERVRTEPCSRMFYLWLALFLASCAAAVCAALCVVYGYLTRVLSDVFNLGWGSIRLSSIIVCAVAAAVYLATVIWMFFSARIKKPAREKKSRAKVKQKKGGGASGGVGGFFSSVWCNIRNVLQLARWSFPFKAFTLRKREAAPNARALRRLKKNEGNK